MLPTMIAEGKLLTRSPNGAVGLPTRPLAHLSSRPWNARNVVLSLSLVVLSCGIAIGALELGAPSVTILGLQSDPLNLDVFLPLSYWRY